MSNLSPASRLRATLAAAILLVLLVACGGGATPTAIPPTATTAAQAATATTPPPTPTTAPSPTATATPAPSPSAAISGSATVAPSPTPPPTATPFPTATPVPRAGLPVRLKIPAIKVDTAIESVGLTPDGAMDVPKNYDNTAWYNLGPRPGEFGNSVINGHLDSKTREAVFWNLKKLKVGDEVIVVGDDGVERRFVVERTEIYKRAEAPLNQIFGPTPGVRLNLITCEGDFNRRLGEYDSNMVVYTKAAP